MTGKDFKNLRVLAVAPSSRGFGFALFEGREVLVLFGASEVPGKKNPVLRAKIEKIISVYKPQMILLPEATSRGQRIQSLSRDVITSARRKQINIELIPLKLVKQSFFADGEGTKHQVAEIIAKRFPEQLAGRLPPERMAWMSEDRRMDIFDAIALMVAVANILPRSRLKSSFPIIKSQRCSF
ncbi:MAG TPA: hypothetical protein VFV23_10790 [Verrucomicrobiae bacterium]|nr:hypothetical protein [Verrucomicrobiae bacterium]